MTDPLPTAESGPESDKGKATESSGKTDRVGLPHGSNGEAASVNESVASNKLTPEEQMALFEKDLKENDWGHQPC